MKHLLKITLACVLALTINACLPDERSATVLESISLSPSSPVLAIGDTQQFTITGHYSDDSTNTLAAGITWESSDTDVATISSSGLLTAVSSGLATITATENSLDLEVTTSITVGSTPALTFSVGGSVSGLSGTLVLQNNSSDDLSVTSDGSFTFDSTIVDGGSYAVTVLTQPAGQTCVVSNGSGTISAANITNITVTCVTNTFTVGGTVSGLGAGKSVVLQNNGGNNLTVSANGAFIFSTALVEDDTYAVTVLTQPAGQTCVVSNGSGTISAANITNITVTCSTNTFTVGGTVSGLGDGETFVLQNNGGDNLTVNTNGSFTFATAIAEGETYAVTVLTQPATQTCSVSNGSGTISGADITNVSLTCVSNDTTLSTSVSTLGLSVNDTGLNVALTGTPRLITITNTGAVSATTVTYSPSPALPSGTTISPASCGTIAASATCILTITPGSTPSAASGDTAPTPITLSVSGENTNTLTPTVNVLTYGSVYQGGYVYAVDDTTPDTGSIGGKVAALTDQSAGVLWSSDGSSSVSYVGILAIDELSTTSSPSPTSPSYPLGTPAYVACNGNIDGACNTSNIVAYYNFNRASGGSAPTPLDQYAAGLCKATIDGYDDWYLPAICEAGYDDFGSGTGCGTQVSPTVQNMLSNLFDAGVGGISGEYWTSTEWSGDPSVYAWSQTFDLGNIWQFTFDKSYNTIRVRCARALTP